jgi:hypothetical protein
MLTETQAECYKRLKCKPKEELEDCKKRLRTQQKEGKEGDQGDADKNRGQDREGDADRNRGQGRDRDNDAKARRQGGDRDNQKEPRQREHDGDDAHDRGGGGGGHGVLRPGTHPGFFSGGIGPSWGICYRGNCGPSAVDYAAFYGTLDFGWHFSGDFHGPAIGANIHGGAGSFGPYHDGRFGAGFKFWWDIQMAHDLGLYFTPFAQAGWSSFIFPDRRFGCDPRFYNCNNNWEHFFNVQAGAMFRMILGDRGLVYVQPMTFDNVFNGGGYGLLYHFEIGGGVIFGG